MSLSPSDDRRQTCTQSSLGQSPQPLPPQLLVPVNAPFLASHVQFLLLPYCPGPATSVNSRTPGPAALPKAQLLLSLLITRQSGLAVAPQPPCAAGGNWSIRPAVCPPGNRPERTTVRWPLGHLPWHLASTKPHSAWGPPGPAPPSPTLRKKGLFPPSCPSPGAPRRASRLRENQHTHSRSPQDVPAAVLTLHVLLTCHSHNNPEAENIVLILPYSKKVKTQNLQKLSEVYKDQRGRGRRPGSRGHTQVGTGIGALSPWAECGAVPARRCSGGGGTTLGLSQHSRSAAGP